jgi:hypothetical protein
VKGGRLRDDTNPLVEMMIWQQTNSRESYNNKTTNIKVETKAGGKCN